MQFSRLILKDAKVARRDNFPAECGYYFLNAMQQTEISGNKKTGKEEFSF